VLVWTIIVGLLTISVMMAAADAIETVRVAARMRRELRQELLGGVGRARGRAAERTGKLGETGRG
jgi:hypothetical protein